MASSSGKKKAKRFWETVDNKGVAHKQATPVSKVARIGKVRPCTMTPPVELM